MAKNNLANCGAPGRPKNPLHRKRIGVAVQAHWNRVAKALRLLDEFEKTGIVIAKDRQS